MGSRDGEERTAAEPFKASDSKETAPYDRFVIGMDVGGTKIRVGAVNPGLFSLIVPFRVLASRQIAEEDPVGRVADIIRSFIRDSGLDAENLSAISIGLPGSIRNDFSTIFQLPNTADGKLDGVNFGAGLGAYFPGVPVLINKDVNNLILADIRENSLSGISAAVYVGTGIGAAVAINGNVLYGSHGFAMDAGHVHLYGAEGICGCGKRGCAETVGSGHALRDINEAFFPQTPIQDLFTEHGSSPELIKFVEDCAEVPAAILTMFDPDTLILGGGVIGMRDFPIERLEESIRAKTERAIAGEGIHFVYSAPRDEKGIIGAAIFAEQQKMRGL